MTAIKLIVSDLDRTLLHTDKSLAAYTVDVLNRCREAGILLAFATARPHRAVQAYTARLAKPLDALIVHNGAQIYAGDVAFPVATISVALRDATLAVLSQKFPRATLSVEIDDTLYGNANLFEIWSNADAVLTDFSDLPLNPANKIIIGVKQTTDLEQYLTSIPDALYLEMSHGETNHLGLIMHRHATKWRGVQALAAHFNIDPAHIAAFGDDFNDISMLANVGMGVAVANAIPEAKNAARFVCGTNNNNGPARWLEEYVL